MGISPKVLVEFEIESLADEDEKGAVGTGDRVKTRTSKMDGIASFGRGSVSSRAGKNVPVEAAGQVYCA